MSVFYLGQFPPPFGGVTVKNALVYQALSEVLPVERLEFRKSDSLAIVFRVLFSSRHDVFVVGFGNAQLQKGFIMALNLLRPSVLGRLVVMAMGGKIAEEIVCDDAYERACKRLRRIYFETESMVDQALEAGMTNVQLFPNCRLRPKAPLAPRQSSGSLRTVFFSRIDWSKGADSVLEAAARTPEVEYHFYGHVSEDFAAVFASQVEALSNVTYHGVFDAAEGDVLSELNGYDVHLFPPRWAFEGVPGVLVETKIAGVPSIVSNRCYNGELVRDGISGFVLADDTVETLVAAIERLDANRGLLDDLKRGASFSAGLFYTDVYIDQLLEDVGVARKECS